MSPLKVPVSSRDQKRGPRHAALVLVEYGDFQCPACGMAYPRLKNLEARLGDKLCVVFRHFPLAEIHPFALLGAQAAEAAGQQGRFWDMHDMIFENQESLGPEGVVDFARRLELDLLRFQSDLEREDLAEHIRSDFLGGVRSGVNGTPSFYLNGLKYEGALEVLAFQALLAKAGPRSSIEGDGRSAPMS